MDTTDVLKSRLQKAETTREEQHHLNVQLQHNYDELLQKLAEAELTIDRMRLGVNTRVQKTIVYELQEQERRRAPIADFGADVPDENVLVLRGIEAGADGLSSDDGAGSRPRSAHVPRSSAQYADHRDRETPSPLPLSHPTADTPSSRSQSVLSPGRHGSLDSQHLALILLCQSLQDDIEALLRRLEQTPEQERRRDAPSIRSEFSGLQQRFGELEDGLDRLRQARQAHPSGANACQQLEDEMAVLREMISALHSALYPGQPLPARTPPVDVSDAGGIVYDGRASPSSTGTLEDVASIGEFGDLSQYGLSMTPHLSDYSPSVDSVSPLSQSPVSAAVPPQATHQHYPNDRVHSSSLSSSSPHRQLSASRHVALTARRHDWQSSDSEGASVVSHSSRRHLAMPTQANATQPSSHIVTSAPDTPRTIAASQHHHGLLRTTFTTPVTASPALLHSSRGLPTTSSQYPHVPAFSGAAPEPASRPVNHQAMPDQPPLSTAPTGHTLLDYVGGDGPGMRPAASVRSSSVQTTSQTPSVGDLDSGYPGSERPSAGYASPRDPKRMSTTSELAPIASQSSLLGTDHQLSSRSSHSLSSAFQPSAQLHPAPLPIPDLSSDSSTAGSRATLSVSPGASSAISSLRAELARLRQELIEQPSARSSVTASPRLRTAPLSPTVQLPPSLSSSSDASEALRNLLDTVSGSRSPNTPKARSRERLSPVRNEGAASPTLQAAPSSHRRRTFRDSPPLPSVPSPASRAASSRRQQGAMPSATSGHVPVQSAPAMPVQPDGRRLLGAMESDGISTDSSQDYPSSVPLHQQLQHRLPAHAPVRSHSTHSRTTPAHRTAHAPLDSSSSGGRGTPQESWAPAANSTPFGTPGRSVATQTRAATARPAGVDEAASSGTPHRSRATHARAGRDALPAADEAVPSPPPSRLASRTTQTPREKAVSWYGLRENGSSTQEYPPSPGIAQALGRHGNATGPVYHSHAGVQTLPADQGYSPAYVPAQPDPYRQSVQPAVHSVPVVVNNYPTPPPSHQPYPYMQQPYGLPAQPPPLSFTPVQSYYEPAAFPAPYLDELDLTEANWQAHHLKRKSQGMVQNLRDSLSYQSSTPV